MAADRDNYYEQKQSNTGSVWWRLALDAAILVLSNPIAVVLSDSRTDRIQRLSHC